MTSMTSIMLGQLKNHVQKVLRQIKNDPSINIVECTFALNFRKDAKDILKKATALDDKGITHEVTIEI